MIFEVVIRACPKPVSYKFIIACELWVLSVDALGDSALTGTDPLFSAPMCVMTSCHWQVRPPSPSARPPGRCMTGLQGIGADDEGAHLGGHRSQGSAGDEDPGGRQGHR
jgi:hypothetical protein